MLDPTTFGSSPAAKILAERLDRLADPKLTRRVSAFLHQTNTGFAQLAAVEDDRWFKRLVVSWRKDRLGQVSFHDDLDSYVKNLVTAASKDWINGDRVPWSSRRGTG